MSYVSKMSCIYLFSAVGIDIIGSIKVELPDELDPNCRLSIE